MYKKDTTGKLINKQKSNLHIFFRISGAYINMKGIWTFCPHNEYKKIEINVFCLISWLILFHNGFVYCNHDHFRSKRH